jgi:hypothetical protein
MFGHGMWFGLLVWKPLGFTATDSLGMKAFRRFQLGLPMLNCGVYTLLRGVDGHWRVRADKVALRRVSSLSTGAT